MSLRDLVEGPKPEQLEAAASRCKKPAKAPAARDDPRFAYSRGGAVLVDCAACKGTLAREDLEALARFADFHELVEAPEEARSVKCDPNATICGRCQGDQMNLCPLLNTAPKGPRS